MLCHAFLMRIHAKEEAVVAWAGGVKRSGAIVFGTMESNFTREGLPTGCPSCSPDLRLEKGD